MPDESLLRGQARYAIRSGKLPSRQPDRTWGGPGVGVVCIICDQRVAQDQMEFAIGFAGDETMPGVDTYRVHLHCFAAWEFERHQDGGPHSSLVA